MFKTIYRKSLNLTYKNQNQLKLAYSKTTLFTEYNKQTVPSKQKEELQKKILTSLSNSANTTKSNLQNTLDREQRWKEIDEENRQTNSKVLRRELFNDSIQLPLKFFAFMQAPHHSAAVFGAEFTRSAIDSLNHLTLFLTNYFKIQPNENYPYGMDKIKNVAALLPAILFFYFGIETLYHSFHEALWPAASAAISENESSFFSIASILVSLGVEVTVIAKNLVDASKLTPGITENTSLITKLKNLFQKKDPLLQAVLYENFVTLISTSVPLACSIINIAYSSRWIEFIGSGIIGIIEIYCGYHLAQENFPKLIGQGVELETLKEITKIIEENQYIESVTNQKAVTTGANKFRFKADISFKLEVFFLIFVLLFLHKMKFHQEIKQDYSESIERITYQYEIEERQEEILELIEAFPKRLLKDIQMQLEAIETAIYNKFPDCIDIDLEINHSNLSNYVDEQEKIRNHQDMGFEGLDNVSRNWIEESVQQVLGKNYEQKIQNQNLNEPTQINKKNLRKQIDFYQNHISPDFIEEFVILNEDILFEIINEDAQLGDKYVPDDQILDRNS